MIMCMVRISSLKLLLYVFILTFLSTPLHAQQTTTVLRVVDGYTEYEGDCNDGDDTVYPGACDIKGDGIDQDCEDGDRTKGKPCPDSGGGNKERNCTDGIDNDSDGLIDCDDRDCRKDPSCSG